ncbi:MAG: TonB-dependent receptor plug domain-containing protein [Acidobacteriota bacterium]
MPVFHLPGARRFSAAARALGALLLAVSAALASAATVNGVVTDASGARIPGARVTLISKGAVVGEAVTRPDGSFQVTTGYAGRFFLVVSAPSFRQLHTPNFYAGQLDAVQRDIVLEPQWVRQSIVVTATGTPTPQPQTSSSTTVLSAQDLARHISLVDALRQVPGAFVVQDGERGAQSSVFLRGGDSRDTMVLLDGVDATDLGGGFDFGPFANTALESAEVYRGPDSNLYGGNADSGVISLTTPHGTTSFPSLQLAGETGNFNTSGERINLSGARGKYDYLGAYSWFQTDNSLPRDPFHQSTAAANLGWQPTGSTQIRAVAHYNTDASGVPNAWDFYHVADDVTQKDQDIYLSGSLDNQTTAGFHNRFLYGLTRKREQAHHWNQQGSGTFDAYGDSYGDVVTITGANGYSATGQALLDYAGTYPNTYQIVSNRDQYMYQGDLTWTQHLTGLIGFRYERERGADPGSFYPSVERNNYEYLASVHGDFKSRFYYTLSGGIEHYSLFGTHASPHGGFSYYILRPRNGVFSGTRILFNFARGVREPSLTDQFYSLYSFLQQNGGQSTIDQLHIAPLDTPENRAYEGGVEQNFLSEHIVFRTTFFHNEFGRQIEYVGLNLIPELLPNLTPAQQNQLEQFLQANGAYELSINSEAYRSLGVETSVESGIGRSLFLRGGYTYLDSVVQRSFTNSDAALLGPIPTFDGIPVGAYSPLQGARPFRRPPHTGFFSATWAGSRINGLFTAAFASRSDDSTFLENAAYGPNPNALLLPNRNLDFGYAQLGIGGSFRLLSFLTLTAQANNLTSDQHIAPIGYPSLPFNFLTGLRVDWGMRRKP